MLGKKYFPYECGQTLEQGPIDNGISILGDIQTALDKALSNLMEAGPALSVGLKQRTSRSPYPYITLGLCKYVSL